jgi:tetratricopeptide (TPR) repeat protein
MVEQLLASEAPPYAGLIVVLAEMGRLREAHQLLAEWEEVYGANDAGYRTDIGRAAGSIALAEGNPDSAVSAFLTWHSAGFVAANHIYNRGLVEAANAHDRAGRPDSAIVYYERARDNPSIFGGEYESAWLPHAVRRLGELYESLGHHEQAIEYYSSFIDAWENADPILQPQVEAARRALERLTGEGR